MNKTILGTAKLGSIHLLRGGNCGDHYAKE